MSKHVLRLAGVMAGALASLGAAVLTSLPAGASESSVTSAPAKGLLTTAQAKRLGFGQTATKASTSTKTGVTGCSKGAQVAYENTSKKTGLISEVLICKTTKVASGLITKEKKVGTAVSSMKPPKALGSTAIERAAEASTYAIYWQQGKIIELLAFDANIDATSSSAETSVPATPLSSGQQQTLVKAALEQNSATQ
jgi:hypothetical protein